MGEREGGGRRPRSAGRGALLLLLAACLVGGATFARGQSRDIAAQPAQREARVALVIGNGAYAESPLNNPANDARGMAQALRAQGFDVIERVDVDLRGMRRAVAEFGERMHEGGAAVFYYSGHGMQVNGRNYLIPIGAQIPSETYVGAETLEVNSVLGEMDAARSRVNVVILDACRNNPLARRFRSAQRGLAFMQAPQGTFIAYATSPGDVADDGAPGGYGVFTGELLRAIHEPLKVEEMFKRVAFAVQQRTQRRQTPWTATNLTGDFSFAASMIVGLETREEMVLVPGSEFMMGSNDYDDEKPPHRVHLDAYYIDKYETTNALYKRLMDATGRQAPSLWNESRWNGGAQPVVGVDWHDADAYCKWAGKRLPTEAEWEKAARGADGRKYPWGDQWGASRANSSESRLGKSGPVGSYPTGVSPYGAHDMAGNVWEWVADWYASDYYKRSPDRNPKGPDTGTARVLRGGSWYSDPVNLRSAGRDDFTPDSRLSLIGFRCARGTS